MRSRLIAEVVVVVSELGVLQDEVAHGMGYGVGWVDRQGEIYSRRHGEEVGAEQETRVSRSELIHVVN